jgi:hypothetical protein
MTTRSYPIDELRKRFDAHSAENHNFEDCSVGARDLIERYESLPADYCQGTAAIVKPRLHELFWYLESVFQKPGSAPFTLDYLTTFPEAVGPFPDLPSRGGRYTFDRCIDIAHFLGSHHAWKDVFNRGGGMMRIYTGDETLDMLLHPIIHQDSWDLRDKACRTFQKQHPVEVGEAIERFTPEFFWLQCAEQALSRLPDLLRSMLQDRDGCGGGPGDLKDRFARKLSTPVWFLSHDWLECLVKMMDVHAERVLASKAPTVGLNMALDEIDYAIRMRRNVMVAADSRRSKTAAAELAAEAYPGRCRLVTAPVDGGKPKMAEAYLSALHVDLGMRANPCRVKDVAIDLMRRSGMVFLLDEGHRLLAAKPKIGQKPVILEWVRATDMDRKRGFVFLVTRQTWATDMDRMVSDTQFQMEQVGGRLEKACVLPTESTLDEIKEVAQKTFPGIPAELLEQTAAAAADSTSAFDSVQSLAARASYAAAKRKGMGNGPQIPEECDVRAAIEQWESRPDFNMLGSYKAPSTVKPPVQPDPQSPQNDASPCPGRKSPPRRPRGTAAPHPRQVRVAPQTGPLLPPGTQPSVAVCSLETTAT